MSGEGDKAKTESGDLQLDEKIICLLIDEIKKREPIWQKKNKLHSNKKYLDVMWNDIAIKLQKPSTYLISYSIIIKSLF